MSEEKIWQIEGEKKKKQKTLFGLDMNGFLFHIFSKNQNHIYGEAYF